MTKPHNSSYNQSVQRIEQLEEHVNNLQKQLHYANQGFISLFNTNQSSFTLKSR